jgi:hypothetical protein
MPAVSLTGGDTAQIDGIILATLADGNAFDITFPNNLATVKAGKNGNIIYAKNEMGRMCDINLRVLLGGSDDKYLNSRLQQWISDPSSFSFLTGMFIKRVGDGLGNLQSKVYNCSGGTFVKQVEAKTAAEGDTEQSVAIYFLTFGACQVSIQ